MNDQELAQYLASETGKVLRQVAIDFGNQATAKDLGQAADEAGHNFLINQFRQYRPLDHVLSEEGEDNLERLTASRVWIVDPLDGTSHYSNGESDYAVHIALWEHDSVKPGKLSASAISVPDLELVFGMNEIEKNAEVIDRKNHGPIRILVSASRPPKEIELVCENLQLHFPELGAPLLISMGSVGAKLASILNGNADLYLNTGGFYDWDIAAPAAIAKSFGLSVCDIYGNELQFNQENVYVPNALFGKPEFVTAVINYFKQAK
jgi:3'(2'), 5'-bisphosphate nucleotidase